MNKTPQDWRQKKNFAPMCKNRRDLLEHKLRTKTSIMDNQLRFMLQLAMIYYSYRNHPSYGTNDRVKTMTHRGRRMIHDIIN